MPCYTHASRLCLYVYLLIGVHMVVLICQIGTFHVFLISLFTLYLFFIVTSYYLLFIIVLIQLLFDMSESWFHLVISDLLNLDQVAYIFIYTYYLKKYIFSSFNKSTISINIFLLSIIFSL